MPAKKKAVKKTTKKTKKVKKQTPVIAPAPPEVDLELLEEGDYEPETFVDDEDLDIPTCDEDYFDEPYFDEDEDDEL